MPECKTVKPFRGWRYSERYFHEIHKIVCPPYDVIDESMHKKLLDVHPLNYVRVVLSPTSNRDAGFFLKRLVEEGAIVQDEDERIYVLRQSWREGDETKTSIGIIALVNINSKILAHEATDGRVIEDRVELMHITGFVTCPIFLVSSVRFTHKIKSFQKLFDFTDTEGVFVEFGYTEPEICAELENSFFLIADGHHRFQAIRKVLTSSGDRYFMAYITDSTSTNIYAIHRLVRREVFDRVMQNFERYCKFRGKVADDVFSVVKRDDWTFAVFDGREAYLFDAEISDKLPSEFLHEYILREIREVEFEANLERILKMVRAGQKFAILLKPVSISHVWDVSLKGKVMPRKSTYFWPKVPSGLVLQKLEKLEGEVWR